MELKKVSRITLVIISLVTIIMGMQLPHVKFNYDFERFFPANDAETAFFRAFTQKFGSDNDYFLIGMKPEEGIFNAAFLNKLDQLTKKLESYPAIELVHSPTNMRALKRDKFSATLIQSPYIHLNDETRYPNDSVKIYNSDLVGYLFSEDRQSIAIFARHSEDLMSDDYETMATFVRSSVDTLGFEKAHYAGKSFGQTHFINLIQREAFTFIGLATLLIIVFLWISYRSIWGIYLPMAVVGLTVLWTIGIMTLLGRPLDLISNVIPTILLIIGVSDVVHLLTYYLTSLQKGKGKWEGLKAAIQSVGKATVLTTITTAIGFLTLTTSSFISLVDLGIFSTIGLVIAFTLTYTLLPSILINHPILQTKEKRVDSFWNATLSKCHVWVMKHPRTIIGISIVVMSIGILGSSQIKMNNYILDDLRDSDTQKQDFTFFEQHFGGARSFDCMVSLKVDSLTIFTPAILRELEQVDHYLRESYGVSNLVSPARLIAEANRVYNFNKPAYERVPTANAPLQRLLRKIDRFNEEYEVDRLLTPDKKEARIRGLIPDLGSFEVRKKDEAFYAFVEEKFPNTPIEYKITGAPFLMDLNNQYLAQNILYGLVFALVIISILFTYLFRSFKLVLITLVPNILPLLFVGGLMGFLGVDLKISTSIIFIIAFGIAVDDSIHFLSRFKKEWEKHPLEKAIQISYVNTGKAIMVTSFILTSGFLTLCTSHFLGTFYLGFLIAITLLVALIADLTILPVLLKVLLGKEESIGIRKNKVEEDVQVYSNSKIITT